MKSIQQLPKTININKKKIHIWPVKDTPDFVVSINDCWAPGVFTSPAAALIFAALLSEEEMCDLWDENDPPKSPLNYDEVVEYIDEFLYGLSPGETK